jgi:hypothetical protein
VPSLVGLGAANALQAGERKFEKSNKFEDFREARIVSEACVTSCAGNVAHSST